MRALEKLAVLLEAALVGASLHPEGQKALADVKDWLLSPPETPAQKKRKKRVKKAAEKLHGGKADGKSDSAFDSKALAEGMAVEREHTKDPAKQKEIAKDHLTEMPDYYKKLKKYVEKDASVNARLQLLRAAQSPSPMLPSVRNYLETRAGARVAGGLARQGAFEPMIDIGRGLRSDSSVDLVNALRSTRAGSAGFK